MRDLFEKLGQLFHKLEEKKIMGHVNNSSTSTLLFQVKIDTDEFCVGLDRTEVQLVSRRVQFFEAYDSCLNLGGTMPCPGDGANQVTYSALNKILDMEHANPISTSKARSCLRTTWIPVWDELTESRWECRETGEELPINWKGDQPNGGQFQNCGTHNSNVK